MNQSQAMARLRKIYGKNAALQDTKRPTSPELRQQQQDARRQANERRLLAERALTERREKILSADAEYQNLLSLQKAAVRAANNCPFPEFRYSAGELSSLAFHVRAQGDSLEEIVEQIERKAKQ
jgi:hypothetical protein